MFELNLIKDRIERMEADRRLYSLLIVFYCGCILVIILFLFRSLGISSGISAYKKEMAVLRGEIANDRQQYGVDRLESEWKKNYDQLSLVDRVYTNRTDLWTQVHELMRILPSGVTIESLKIGRLEDPHFAMEVLANRGGLELVNNLMGEISRNPRIKKAVKLDSQQRRSIGEREVEAFTISIPK